MKTTKALLLFLAAFALTACSSDPEWADPEAHEKTIQLNEKYGPLMIGTWHYENSSDKHRFFELLTFKDDTCEVSRHGSRGQGGVGSKVLKRYEEHEHNRIS